MKTEFKFRTVIYIVVTLIVLLSISFLCNYAEADVLFDRLLDIDYFDLLAGQIANTLIVVSLTSVLSTNFGQAYWVDIKDSKLVTPFWGCFIGITIYLLTGLVYSVLSYALEFKAGIIVSAVGATLLLVVLTFKMISIYFGKEELKKQLRMKYKKLLILNNTSYVSDYLRRLEKYLELAKKETFPQKKRFVAELKKEIEEIKRKLNSEDESQIDECHNEHINKYVKGIEILQEIDLKIIEYTKNAIHNNETEVVKENIELLVESENYKTFFDLLEELFDWDETYACKTLKDISQKNMAWVIKDKMRFFKNYALRKLISDSGKLDAIQNLLLIFEPSNLGMSKLIPQIEAIRAQCRKLNDSKRKLDIELSVAEDILVCMQTQKEVRNEIKKNEANLGKQLTSILDSSTTKELRAFYVPIKEACIAYDEGKFEIANKYIAIILTNFEQEKISIKTYSGIIDIDARISFKFAYVTSEELELIHQLIQKDEGTMAIPTSYKINLLKLEEVILDNNPESDISAHSLEVFRSTLDLPRND